MCLFKRVYRKALATPDLDDLSVITSAWIRFERCNGTMDQLKLCQEQCDERLVKQQMQNTYSGRNSFVTSKNAGAGGGGKAAQKRKIFDRPEKKFTKTENNVFEGKKKAQVRPNVNMGPPAAKQEKLNNSAEMHDTHQVDTKHDNTTIFMSNLSYR